MKNVFKIFSIVLALGLVTKAQAGVLLEPYLAYETGSVAKIETASTDFGGKTSGLNLGFRAAYKLPMMVWLGADYSLMSGGKYAANSAGGDGKIDRSDLYFDVGVDLPVMFRFWLGYGLMNSSKNKFDAGGDTTLKNGSSNIKLGVGFTGLPFVSLNLEYFMHDYKDYESGSASGSADSIWSTHKESGLMLGVSIPFHI